MFPNVFSAVVRCPDLEELPNGHFTGNGTSYRSTALYECAEGYLLIGDALRTCEATGQWTSRMPTCTSKQFIDQCCVAICTYLLIHHFKLLASHIAAHFMAPIYCMCT